MSTLREQMQADLQLRGITPRTQKDYLREVRNLAKFFDKSPEELGEKEVKGVSGSSAEGQEAIRENVQVLCKWD